MTMHDGEDPRRTVLLGPLKLVNFVSLSEDEREMVRRWRNHDSIRPLMYQDHIISREEHAAFLSALESDRRNLYWLVSDTGPLGVVSLNRIDWRNRHAWLGIYADPARAGRGSGKRLMEALSHVAFDLLGMHTLKLEVLEGNDRALRFYEFAGFREEGRLKEYVLRDGTWHNMIIMGIVRSSTDRP
jgi:UDP-4-amino-4,6-dideoxy-N-acetyl-beta-L-altrosamine N-acetyltransferase